MVYLGAGQLQRIAHNSMTRNEGGGFIFQNVGETNPRVAFESNNIQHCGVGVLNNTAIGVVDFYVQNTKLLTIANNYLAHNAGGINVNTTTKDNEVALYANITNNVIVHTTHGDALHIEGLNTRTHHTCMHHFNSHLSDEPDLSGTYV